ncbi:MAG: glycerophosphodiester phosphodiesterase, partial [Sphaerochaetaceae bacterium]|nr:glycerophosphodiester phosphodiesterase [Sphaerochaetaceae bacterium]
MFSSFNWLSVMKAKILAPQIPCALLYEGETSVRHIALQAKNLGIQYLHPDFKLLDDQTVSECRASGIGLNVWTVDNESRLSALLQW